MQNAFECFRNEYVLGERFFDKEGAKSKYSGNQGIHHIIEERKILSDTYKNSKLAKKDTLFNNTEVKVYQKY